VNIIGDEFEINPARGLSVHSSQDALPNGMNGLRKDPASCHDPPNYFLGSS
jgi:hypothetical protein